MKRLLPTLPLLAILVITGCAATAPVGPVEIVDDPADDAVAAVEETGTVGAGYPSISSCDQIAAALPEYVGDIPLNQEQSYLGAEAMTCVWNREETEPTTFEEIQSFEVSLSATNGEQTITMDQAEEYGFGDTYFTDPRLEELGGIALWMDMDIAVAGGGTGSVLLPDVEIAFADLRWGARNLLTRDQLVDVGLRVAAL